MAEFIFTFGSAQVSPISGLRQGRYGQMRYIRIEAPDYQSARDRMIELYGLNWSMQYDASNGDDPAGIKEFNLVELEVLEVSDLSGPRRIEFESPRNAVMRSQPADVKGK